MLLVVWPGAPFVASDRSVRSDDIYVVHHSNFPILGSGWPRGLALVGSLEVRLCRDGSCPLRCLAFKGSDLDRSGGFPVVVPGKRGFFF